MAKRIKLTERQVKLLEGIDKIDSTKKIKITESQYNRLFKSGNSLNEDLGLTTTFIEFAEHGIQFLKDLTNNPSTDGLDPFWIKRGIDQGKLIKMMMDAGILVAGSYAAAEGTRKIYNVRKKDIILVLKKIYNEFSKKPRYDNKTGAILGKNQEPAPAPKEEGMAFLGNDMEMVEDSGYPDGAADDPRAPYNQQDSVNPQASAEYFDFVDEVNDGGKHKLLFLKDERATYVVIYSQGNAMFEDFCSGHNEMTCVMEKLDFLADNSQLEIGECGYDCGSHLIHVLDEEMKSYILEYHARSEEAVQQYNKIFGMNEVTSAGASSGSFEAPLGGTSPIKRNNFPSNELEEVTATGASSGAYETPKVWAKDPKLSRFSKKPMYPTGTIVEDGDAGKDVRYVLNLGEVYVYGRNDAEARKEAKAIVELINKHFNEAWAEPKSLHQQGNLRTGEKAREVGLHEAVAKKTGKTVEEVKEILKKNRNKE